MSSRKIEAKIKLTDRFKIVNRMNVSDKFKRTKTINTCLYGNTSKFETVRKYVYSVADYTFRKIKQWLASKIMEEWKIAE